MPASRPAWGLLVMVALLAWTLHAAAQPREAARWTLPSAAARAVEAAPSVRAAESRRDAVARLAVHASTPVVGNPVVGVRAMFGVPDATAATYAVFVGVPFDLAGRQGRWHAEADAAIESAEAELEAARNDARAEGIAAYIACAEAAAQHEVAERRAAYATQLLSRVRELVAASAATSLDLALAESELAVAQAESVATQRARTEAEAALRTALGLPANSTIDVAPLESPSLTLPDVDALVRTARARRAEPRALQRLAERYRLSEDRLYAEAVEALLVGVEYEAQGNNQTGQSFGVSAQTSLPFARTGQGERAVARGLAELAETEAQLSAEEIERRVRSAAQSVELTSRELELLAERAQPAAERALAATEQLLATGAADVFRVLAARRELASLESRLARVLADAWRARNRLDREIGDNTQ